MNVVLPTRATGNALQPPLALREGVLKLDPPGIEIAVGDIFPPEPTSA